MLSRVSQFVLLHAALGCIEMAQNRKPSKEREAIEQALEVLAKQLSPEELRSVEELLICQYQDWRDLYGGIKNTKEMPGNIILEVGYPKDSTVRCRIENPEDAVGITCATVRSLWLSVLSPILFNENG